MSNKVRVIAFYLPQFHPTPENDKWWGPGFTEWTNVGKAKPLFKGHYQPRVPRDLGYYDLRIPEVREAQAKLAREAGIEGFCYWHYWFGDGERLLERPFNEVLESGKPDFPFCLGWANHSWWAKDWNADAVRNKSLLVEQRYPGLEDLRLHFNFLIKAFNDPRYIKVKNQPLFYIFDPSTLPQLYIDHLHKWSKEAGFQDGLFLVANCTDKKPVETFLDKGYNAVSYQRLSGARYFYKNKFQKLLYRINDFCKKIILHHPPFSEDYKNAFMIDPDIDNQNCVIPSIVPNWDHTPRSGMRGTLFMNSTPALFKKQVELALKTISNKEDELKILFLKSWNEWAEGNYMEPDLKFGKGYITALKEALEDNKNL